MQTEGRHHHQHHNFRHTRHIDVDDDDDKGSSISGGKKDVSRPKDLIAWTLKTLPEIALTMDLPVCSSQFVFRSDQCTACSGRCDDG